MSIIIPTYARLDLLDSALQSLFSQACSNLEIIVVDNASARNISLTLKARYPRIHTIRLPRNEFFAKPANVGLRLARGRYTAIMNDDVVLDPSWLSSALSTFAWDPQIAGVASRIRQLSRPTFLDSAGDHIDLNGRAGKIGWNEPDDARFDEAAQVVAPSGTCSLFRTSALREVGGYDEDFVGYLEDVDLGLRLLLRGYQCVYNPRATLGHHGGATWKARRKALFLNERNSLYVTIKDFPTALLLERARTLLGCHLTPADILGGSSWSALVHGKCAALAHIRATLAKRRAIQATRRVSDECVRSLLSSRRVVVRHL